MIGQMSLWDAIPVMEPLAERMRPVSLDEYIGQEHILGEGKLVRQMIEEDRIASMIFWGEPGVGKTTLAMLIAKSTNADFQSFSAVDSGVKEIKEIIKIANDNLLSGKRTIVFVDEIHRFNKAQQDAFLPVVEKGTIVLIGATTENPSFEINSALLSRMMVITLNPLSIEDIVKVLKNALSSKRGLGEKRIDISEEIILEIAEFANGDARTALNILEKVVYSSQFNDGVIKVTDETLKDCLQRKMLLYSKSGDEHFNLISALHKSMRNSDCNASVYWLARMFEAGEDPLYIARRLVRFASEDVGMADPNALPQAVAAYQAAHFIGRPECNVNLTQAVIYLASAPKSNALYVAYETARADALNTLSEGVPLQLRNASTELLETLGYGKGYEYAHDNEMRITKMDCLPEKMMGREYYKPTEEGFEEEIKKRLLENEKKKEKL